MYTFCTNTFSALSSLLLPVSGNLASDSIDTNEKSSSTRRLIYSSFSSLSLKHTHTHTFVLTYRLHAADLFLWSMSRKTRAVQSIVICCSGLSSDVTNIPVCCCEQQFPPNWKALRPFRHWCYLAAVFPSWPSKKDEPLYISSLSLWIEPKLHHHSNGCLAYIPRDIVIPQIAWKNEIVCVAVGFEALKVCVHTTCVPAGVASICPYEL